MARLRILRSSRDRGRRKTSPVTICINLCSPTYNGLFAGEFEQGKRELKVHVEGELGFNKITLRLSAALTGFGLAYPEDRVQVPLAEGRLVRVLEGLVPARQMAAAP